jgi:hypothetical protein
MQERPGNGIGDARKRSLAHEAHFLVDDRPLGGAALSLRRRRPPNVVSASSPSP